MVLLFYFFRKKYTRYDVSSTLLWQEHLNEIQASPFLKHLQHNVLLYLQLLALCLAMLALMQPFIKTTGQLGTQAVWIVDTSATMLAGDQFEKHKQLMQQRAKDLQQPLTLITTGKQPVVVLQQETDMANINAAIEALAVTYETAYMEQTLAFASTFIEEQTVVDIYTDVLEASTLPTDKQNVQWHIFANEQKLQNNGIEKLAITMQDDELVAMLQLYSDKQTTLTYELTTDNGDVLLTDSVAVNAGELTTVMHTLQSSAEIVQATLQTSDDYSADNTAIAYQKQGSASFTVDATMHSLLQKALMSMNMTITTMQPEQLASAQNTIITNQTALLEHHRTLLIGRDDVELEPASGTVTTVDDRLFTFSKLEDVYVQAVYPSYEGYKTLAKVGDKPLIQRSPTGDIIVLTDLTQTDWALDPSFPLFIWTALQEMSTTTSIFGMFSPNETRVMAVQGGDLYTMDGQFIATTAQGTAFKAPTQPGMYTFREGEQQQFVFVMLQPQEKQLELGKNATIGEVQLKDTEEDTSFVVWFILAMLVVVLIEWEVQRRRGLSIT